MQTTDRRTRKTKEALARIFIEQLKKHPIEKITVTELCNLADLNRSTFYLHYRDIYDLLEDVENDCLQEIDHLITTISRQDFPPEQVTRMILEYIYQRKELLNLFILKMDEHAFWRQIDKKLFLLFKEKNRKNYQVPEEMPEDEFDDIILFLISGFYMIYKKWLTHNCQESIDLLVRRTTKISQLCLDNLLIGQAGD